ncbi:MAG: tyrosine-type recombinase/integrase [Bacillota bacterium]
MEGGLDTAVRYHLEKRYKSSWTIVIDVGIDPATGKRKRITRSVKGTKRQAEQVAQQLVAELQQGTYVKPQKITLADYLRQWLEVACVPRLSPKTIQGYRTCIENHIIPALGLLPVSEVVPLHLQTLYSSLLDTGLSNRTVELVHTVLHAALKQAVKWQLIPRNPADAVEPPRPARPEIHVLKPEQVPALLDAARGSPIEALVIVALSTGLRRGELLALRWEDVDLKAGIIYVRRNLIRVDKQLIEKAPKTKRGQRSVPVPRMALEVLRNLSMRSEATGPNDYVFCRQGGLPLDPSTVTHQFARIAKKMGFEGLRFHDLRHTHATLLLSQGVHPKVVQERLGHETITTTIDTYSHVIPTLQEQARRALDAVFTEWHRFGTGLAQNALPEQPFDHQNPS